MRSHSFCSVSPLHVCTAAIVVLLGVVATAGADIIAYNFSENTGNQVLDLVTPKGPTGTAIWNDSNVRDSGTLAAGAEANLVNDLGLNTGAAIEWSSANVWWNGSGTGSEDAKIVVGYLDDGGEGVRVTVTGIPYDLYTVYGIVGSDQNWNSTYTTLDFLLNGTVWALGGTAAATATAHGDLVSSGGAWIELTTGQVGNYWKVDNLSGSTLSIEGLPRNLAERGSLAAIVIEQIPEPSTALLLGLGALLLRRRRRPRA
jgi:hypothetical protein